MPREELSDTAQARAWLDAGSGLLRTSDGETATTEEVVACQALLGIGYALLAAARAAGYENNVE